MPRLDHVPVEAVLESVPKEEVGKIVKSFLDEEKTDIRATENPDKTWKIVAK